MTRRWRQTTVYFRRLLISRSNLGLKCDFSCFKYSWKGPSGRTACASCCAAHFKGLDDGSWIFCLCLQQFNTKSNWTWTFDWRVQGIGPAPIPQLHVAGSITLTFKFKLKCVSKLPADGGPDGGWWFRGSLKVPVPSRRLTSWYRLISTLLPRTTAEGGGGASTD